MQTEPIRHTKKELANDLGRSRRFVYAMEQRGFRLPARSSEAVAWLREHPQPCRRSRDRRRRP